MTDETPDAGQETQAEHDARAEAGTGLSQPTEGNAFPGAEQTEAVPADAPVDPNAVGEGESLSDANAAATAGAGGTTGDTPPAEGDGDGEPAAE
jgi:hypothetical protein